MSATRPPGGPPRSPGLAGIVEELEALSAADQAAIAARIRARLGATSSPSSAVADLASEVGETTNTARMRIIDQLRMRTNSNAAQSLAGQIASLPTQGKAAAVAHLRERLNEPATADADEPGYPLSSAQEQLWFLDQMQPNSSFYNVAVAHRLRGPLDVQAFSAALSAVIHRHEPLRTRYSSRRDMPVQLVDPPTPPDIATLDLNHLDPENREEQLLLLIEHEINRPFDLRTGPVCRNTLIRLGPEDWAHIFVVHHIAADGWSFAVLFDDIARAYEIAVAGSPADLEPLAHHYRDYAAHQQHQLASGALESQFAYWSSQLAAPLPVVEFEPDLPRPAVQTDAGGKAGFRIDEGAGDRLDALAQRLGVTSFMLSLAIFKAFVHRNTGAKELVVGVPTAGRPGIATEQLVGYFINTVAIRTTIDGNDTLEELAMSVRDTVVGVYGNLDAPFDHVVRRLNPARDPSRTPVFQLLFQHFSEEMDNGLHLPNIEVTALEEQDYPTSKFDFEVDVHTVGGSIIGDIAYNADLYTQATADRIAKNYATFLDSVVAAPDRPIGEARLMTPEEELLILTDFAGGGADIDDSLPFELIKERARAHPDDIAVAQGDEELSFGDLMVRVAALQHHFAASGVTVGSRVALLVERNIDAIVAMLTATSMGSAYVPIDPTLPAERIEWTLEDADPSIVVTSGPDTIVDFGRPAIDLSSLPALATPSTTLELFEVSPSDPAYIIFTSGTSGRPKGAVISHRALGAMMHSAAEVYGFKRGERMLQFHSFSFDASVEEIFAPLGAGATLVLRTDDMLGSARRLLRSIEEHDVTVFFCPTAFWHEIATEMIGAELAIPAALRLLALGGEAVAPELVAQWKDRYDGAMELFNGYGPTEATVDSVASNLSETDEPGTRAVTIGRPFPTVRALVLDERFKPVPIGVPGELILGGPQVGDGYLNRPELTEQRFIEDPISGTGTVYRTGDRVRWRPDGNLEFLGRLDRQVKINGYRIEPAEVEAAFFAHPAVSEIAVIPEEVNQQQQLAAYAVVETATVTGADLAGFVRQRLPAFMVPARIEISVELPRGAGGKVDVRSLADQNAPTPSQPQQRPAPVRRGLSSAPLSFAQARMWFVDQLEPDQTTYLVSGAVRLVGSLNRDALQGAFDAVVRRHEILRTRIVDVAGVPSQTVDEFNRQRLDFHDLRRLDTSETRQQVERIISEAEERPFDLAKDAAIRFGAIRTEADDHTLFAVAHHITFDAESFGVFWADMATAYSSIVHGNDAVLDPLPIQYSDFAAWQREAHDSGDLADDLGYWMTQLSGPLPKLELPTDRLRPTRLTTGGGNHSVEIDSTVWDELQGVAKTAGATPFMVLTAAVATWLHRLTGDTDIVVGMPVTERDWQETEGLIGMFVNTLPIRLNLDPRSAFETVLHQVRDQVLGALQHRSVPFEVLVDAAPVERDPSRSPLFQVVCAIAAAEEEDPAFADLDATHEYDGGSEQETAKYELTVYGLPDGERDEMAINLEYNADIFGSEIIEYFADALCSLIKSAAAEPHRPIANLDVLEPRTRLWLERTLNATTRPYPAERRIAEVFHEVAAGRRSATAIVDGARSLSYGDLANEASALADVLRGEGIRGGDAVGISIERSCELIIAMLAILELDACYIPLDPSYPQQRLEYMRQDSGLGAIVSIRRGEYVVTAIPRQEPRFANRAPAYVMYTSGSTGRPKGVVIPHRAILRLVRNTSYVELGPNDVVAHASNTSFDAATFEIWGALLNGATVAVLDADIATSPAGLAEALPRLGVTAMFVTTALFNAIARERPDAFSTVASLLFGGEAVDPEAVRRILAARPPNRLVHVYGPTESTTFASWHLVTGVDHDATTVPIGLPITNTTLHILDSNMSVVPLGVAGDLYIGGEGLADGYLGDTALTDARFLSDPINGSGRLYKTGDIARRNLSGAIEFVGRADRQVKLRGFRVEPREIETHLRRDPHVAEALVRVWERADDARLVGYVVPTDVELTAEQVHERLRRMLPDHMIPAHIEIISEIPRNANGKVATELLPLPEVHAVVEYVAPTDPRSSHMALLWQRILKVHRIGLTDNFFDLGGHSLLAVELMAAVDREMGSRVPLSALFEAPTLGEFATRVSDKTDIRTLPRLVVPIHTGSGGNPIFCIHPGGGNVFVYESMSRHLHDDQPVLGIEASGVDGIGRPHRTIEEMAAEYVEIIKQVQASGPYQLIGYSLGGLIAFETAQQLRARGEEVSLLALLDTYFPRDAGWWAELRGSISSLTGRGVAGVGEAVEDIWLSIREVLGKLRHGSRWTYYRLRRRPIPHKLAGKQLTHIGLAAYRHYEPLPYDGSILFFRATGVDGKSQERPDLTWHEVAAVEKVDVRGEHTGARSIMDDPYVGAIGDELDRRLRGTSS